MKTPTKIFLSALAGAMLVGGAIYATRSFADDMPGMMARHAAFGHRGGPGGMFGPGAMLFELLDGNADGKVTKTEVEAFRTERLARFDADKDGSLGQQEFTGLWMEISKPMQVRGFQMLDADGDGKVTSAEMAKPLDRLFSRLDDNNDGTIAKDDLGRRGGGERREPHRN